MEDDIRITKDNPIWWLQARKQLQKHGPYPGLLRHEVRPNTKERYSRDVIAPAIFEHQQTGAQRWGLRLPHPPLPLAGPSPNGSGTHGGTPAKARCGNQQDQRGNPRKGASMLTFWNGPPGFQCRPMVGYEVNKQRLDPRYLVHHLPNSYGSDSRAEAGKVALAGVVRHRDS